MLGECGGVVISVYHIQYVCVCMCRTVVIKFDEYKYNVYVQKWLRFLAHTRTQTHLLCALHSIRLARSRLTVSEHTHGIAVQSTLHELQIR